VTGFGTLYLLPVPINETDGLRDLPLYNAELARGLEHFIAEDARTARRFLKQCAYGNLDKANISELNGHTPPEDLRKLLHPLLAGHSVGLMSDAGCPGVADPGAPLIELAHEKEITVMPLTGPSSILLAVMSSGFNGQNFAFVGYLPVDSQQRVRRLKELEQLARKQRQAQFFIETPYRNRQLMESLIANLQPATRLFAGMGLGGSEQIIISKTVAAWKKGALPDWNKKPAVFGIY
jgi:16S rRNA (cytidine1402-2'-O)-methyltransferase